MKSRPQKNSLAGQVVAVNVLLVLATLFAASAAANLNLELHDERWSFLLLALTIVLVLLVNMMMLRRRFLPLERLIAAVESIDPAADGEVTLPSDPQEAEEVGRLAESFRRMLGRIEDERRRSGRLGLRAQEEERRRLARDLHDEVNQALTAILLRLEAMSHSAAPEQAEELAELKRLINQAMSELLQLARQLRPSALDDHGLMPAVETQLKRFAARTGVEVTLNADGDPDTLPEDVQTAVYRILQEALANVGRHAGATAVAVEVQAAEDSLELHIRDDGAGFDPGTVSRNGGDGPGAGLGLSGMSERARLAGGELDVRSAPGGGTTATLP